MAGGLVSTASADRSVAAPLAALDPMPRAADQPGRRRQRRIALAGVLLAIAVGVALRAMWASAYLPYVYHWDELTNVTVGEEMANEGTFDPGFYNYPALVFAAQAAVLIPAAAFTDYDADERSIVDMQTTASAEVDRPGLMTALRWATGVIPGAVTIATAGAIGWLASRRAWVTTTAAFLVALSALDLRFGIFVTPDALTGMAATLAGLGASCVALRPSRRTYILTGAAVGLAGAAKYNAVAVCLGLVAAHMLAGRHLWRDRRHLLEAAGTAVLVFGVANLGAVLHPGDLIHGVGSEANHYSTWHFGNQGNSPAFNGAWLLRTFGLALPITLASLWSPRTRVRRIGIVLLVQSFGYFAFISIFPVRFARNLLPITGTIAAAAAIGAFAVVERLVAARRSGAHAALPRRGPLVVASLVVALACLAVPVIATRSAMHDRSSDPWAEAQHWINDNVPAGSRIYLENRAPILDDERYVVRTKEQLGSSPFSNYVFSGVDYVVAVSETFEPFLDRPDEFPEITDSYRRLLSDRCVVEEFEGAGRRILVAAPDAAC